MDALKITNTVKKAEITDYVYGVFSVKTLNIKRDHISPR